MRRRFLLVTWTVLLLGTALVIADLMWRWQAAGSPT